MPDTILVTGGAGFVGGHLLDLLVRGQDAHDIRTIVAWHRPGHSPGAGSAPVAWAAVDLLDRAAVMEAVARVRPSVVYHCGGAAHVGHAWSQTEATFAVNVRGTHHLLDALAQTGTTSRVLIPSSSLVYRPSTEPLSEDRDLVPASPYGLSKLAQELIGLHAASDRLTVCLARAFTHIGPRQDPDFAASSFARQIADIEAGRQPPEIHVGNLEARRDLTDVRDTVRAYTTIMKVGRPGRPYNVCSGRAVAINDVLRQLLERARVPITITVDADRLRPSDMPLVVGDAARAQRELGWTPRIPLEQTLDDILEFWRSR